MNHAYKQSEYFCPLEEYLIKNEVDYIVEYSLTGEYYYYTKEQISVYQVWENTNDDYPYYFDEYVLLMSNDKTKNISIIN